MKRVIFHQHGTPQDVIELLEEPDPIPGPSEVRVRNQVMTINPADLLTIEGRYGHEPITLPCTPGTGAYGIVDAVGDGVKRLSVGDAVLPVGSGGLWSDTVILHERMAPKAPANTDPEQAAMMRANPGTAYLMLTDLVALNPGDWVIQNAANSSVGRLVIRFARDLGLHTINIVRRDDVVSELKAEGADAVIVDDGSGDLPSHISEASPQAPKLALDAIGGSATAALASTLANRGLLVVYGLLSGIDSTIGARDLVFRDITTRGFWLADWYATAEPDQIKKLHGLLAEQLAAGSITSAVDARYPLEKIKDALAHAAQGGRNGKIILTGTHNA
jgi:NADPH:quinone reductase-like Zn-dependent oxidoreductase